jgi:hypothetical protein
MNPYVRKVLTERKLVTDCIAKRQGAGTAFYLTASNPNRPRPNVLTTPKPPR